MALTPSLQTDPSDAVTRNALGSFTIASASPSLERVRTSLPMRDDLHVH